MFQNKEELPKTIDNRSSTFLCADAMFKGELTFKGTMCIDGKFEGQLKTDDTLIIGENGEVLADVQAGAVICKGIIRGNIIATEKVEMNSTSKIKGNVQTPAVSIDLGAVFEGKCNVTGI